MNETHTFTSIIHLYLCVVSFLDCIWFKNLERSFNGFNTDSEDLGGFSDSFGGFSGHFGHMAETRALRAMYWE